MDELKNELGLKVRKIRKNKKMTQKMLANGICSQSVLSRIENNQEIPNVLVLAQLCARLGVSMDQLILTDYDKLQKVRLFFDEMNELLIIRDYQAMKELIDDGHMMDYLYLDKDIQLFLFYQAFVKYCVDRDCDETLFLLKNSLAYTYTENKKENVSLIEVQIINCLGKVYTDQGLLTLANKYIQLSYKHSLSLPKESLNFEFARNYYHYACLLFREHKYKKVIEVANEGIKWATEKLSLYYLEDLYEVSRQAYVILGENQNVNEMEKNIEFIQHLTNSI